MSDQRGFTLIEVVVALAILLVVIVGFVSTTGKATNVVATSDRNEAGIQLASDRIDQIKADPNYTTIDSVYGGTENSFPTLPGFKRVTQIVRNTSSGNDFKRITVTVTGPGIATSVARSATVSAP
jgi:prepilin-type N-terminal cleavage/methylation domain-containing protein